MSVTINLHEDWKNLVVENLQRSGYTVDSTDDVDTLTFQYFNALKRAIDVKPREVFEAKGFRCPDEYGSSLAMLKSKTEAGENLNPYLSKNLKRLNYSDGMLNDWGIYHFHLGQNSQDDGFIERTGSLLFALVTDASVHLVGIYEHGDWSRKSILEVIQKSWPELLDQFKVRGVVRLAYDFDDNELAELRKAGISTFVQMQDGSVYAPPGGGYMSNGQSLEVRRRVDNALRSLDGIEKWVKENTNSIVEMAQAQGTKINYPLNFSLLIEGDKIGVLETGSRVFFFGWQ